MGLKTSKIPLQMPIILFIKLKINDVRFANEIKKMFNKQHRNGGDIWVN